MIRYHFGLLFTVFTLCGCQSFSGMFQNRFASAPEYSTEEMLALSQPLPEATSPELGNGSMLGGAIPAGPNGQNGNAMALASYNSANTPGQAGGNSAGSLVEAGQQAIRDAGENNLGGLQQARQLFEQALMMDSGNSDAHHGIAIVADLQQDWMAAERHYKQALSRDPSNPSLLNDLGYSYLLQNRYHESQQYLNQAIQISAKHERAHLNLALLSLRRGDMTSARQTLAQVYSQQDVQVNLSRLQQDLQKLNAKSSGTGMTNNNNSSMTVGVPQNPANAVYPVSQSQPADWNAQRPMGPSNAPQPGANPAYSVNGYQSGMPGQGFPQSGGIQHYTDGATSIAIDPALRTSDSDKPISLYPPGVVRDEVLNGASNQQNQSYLSGQGMSQNGQIPMANDPYPNSQFGNGQNSTQPNSGGFPSQHSNGMQMPRGNDSSGMLNQFPLVNAQPASNQLGHAQQQQGMMNSVGMPSGNSPMNGNSAAFGLNVGPGMPFPVGNQSGNNMGGNGVGQNQPGQNFQPGQFGQQAQFNTQAEPLLNQYPSGNPNANPAGNGFGQANYGQPAAGQPFGGQAQLGQFNASQVSYGQPQGGIQVPSGQGGMPMNPGAFGQASYQNVQPQNFGAPSNSQMGMMPGGGMPNGGMNGMPQMMNPSQGQFNGAMSSGQNSPMQQFEQNQMNRINDQYQQAIQQMNSRGFSGQ